MKKSNLIAAILLSAALTACSESSMIEPNGSEKKQKQNTVGSPSAEASEPASTMKLSYPLGKSPDKK
jgi:hypothetical protein